MMERDVILACEESGGMSILGHVPEKDGILAGLLAAEMICAAGEGIGDQILRLRDRFGTVYNRRIDLALDQESGDRIRNLFFGDRHPAVIAGRKVVDVNLAGGVSLGLDNGSVVIVRLSGTEPLARLYIQADDPGEVDALAEGVGKLTGLDVT